MGLTLLEASKFVDGDLHRQGVIETFGRSTDLMRIMPFMDIPGNSYSYNTENKLPNIGFRGINEGYTAGVGVINPATERLRIVGGELDVDNFLITTLGESVRDAQEAMKVKALSLYLADQVINGNSLTNVRSFDGLRVRIGGSQLIPANTAAPSANSALSLEALDAAIDEVDGANALIMSKAMKRKINTAARTNVGGDIETTIDQFGFQVSMYNGIPMYIVDDNHLGQRIVDFNEVGPGGGTTSTSIYVANFGDNGVTGLQNGTMQVEDLGKLESSPVQRTRIEWYVTMAVLSGRAAARVYGITNAPVTA